MQKNNILYATFIVVIAILCCSGAVLYAQEKPAEGSYTTQAGVGVEQQSAGTTAGVAVMTTAEQEARAKEAERLALEAKKFKKDMTATKEKLELFERRDKLAQDALAASQAQLKEISASIDELKSEKVGKSTILSKGIKVAVIIIAGVVLFILLRRGVRKFETVITKKDKISEDELTQRMRTLSKLINWLGGIVILIIILYMTLETLGFNVAPLLAGASIIGIAFGFGGQYLIRDVINGLFILVEGQYSVGDVVKIGEHSGLVEDINLRVTILRGVDGSVITIPNGAVNTVVNLTKDYSNALLEIGVAYKENVDRAMDVIKELGRDMRRDPKFGKLILEDLEMLGVEDLAESQVTIKFRMKTLPTKQWDVAREFRRRVKNKFDELGIEMPFPHRTIYVKSDRDILGQSFPGQKV